LLADAPKVAMAQRRRGLVRQTASDQRRRGPDGWSGFPRPSSWPWSP